MKDFESSVYDGFNDLVRRVEITKDARFQANIRLERRQKRSYFVISILFLFVIVVSLIPNMVTLNQFQTQLLLSITVVNFVFIIITTFMEAAGNFYHRGEHLHRSARSIASVHNQLVLLSDEEKIDQSKIKQLQSEYQAALDDCSFNHENIDYLLVQTQKPKLFSNKISQASGWLEFMTSMRILKYYVFDFSWAIPHFLFALISIVLIYVFIFMSVTIT